MAVIHELPSLEGNNPEGINVASITNLLVSQKTNNNDFMTIISEIPKYEEIA